MAILENLGLSAAVKVDGQELIEYSDPDPNPRPDRDFDPDKTVIHSTYIEAHDDKEFAVVCKIAHRGRSEPANYGFTFEIHVDGKYATAILATKEELNISSWSGKLAGVNQDLPGENRSLLHKFRFSAVATVDDVAKSELKKHLKAARGLGAIMIEVRRVTTLGPSSNPAKNAPKGKSLKLSEKALKGQAISHGTSYSPPVTASRRRYTNVKYLDNQVPIAIFIFKYRSRAALETEMILPRSQSIAPEAEDGINDLSLEELRQIARERHQEMKQEKQVKRENRSAIKREFDEYFDLTDDADVPRVSKVLRTQERVKVDLTDS